MSAIIGVDICSGKLAIEFLPLRNQLEEQPNLDAITEAKAELEEEFRKLAEQEVQLRQKQSADAIPRS